MQIFLHQKMQSNKQTFTEMFYSEWGWNNQCRVFFPLWFSFFLFLSFFFLFIDASCTGRTAPWRRGACARRPCGAAPRTGACPSCEQDVGRPTPDASGASASRSSTPSCAPSSTSSGGSGTRSWSAVRSGRVRERFRFSFVWSGIGWSGTPSPAPGSGIGCTRSSAVWFRRFDSLHLKRVKK